MIELPEKILAFVVSLIIIIVCIFVVSTIDETQTDQLPNNSLYGSDWWGATAIQINCYDYVANPLDEFTIKVDIPQTIGRYCNSGASIRFVDLDNSTIYQHDREGAWSTTGTNTYWVNITQLLTTNFTFWMYFRSTSALDSQNPDLAWDRNFGAVYHMNSTTDMWDSTINSNNATENGAGTPVSETGVAGNCLNLTNQWSYFIANFSIRQDYGDATYPWDINLTLDGVGGNESRDSVALTNRVTTFPWQWQYYVYWSDEASINFTMNNTLSYNNTLGAHGTTDPGNVVFFANYSYYMPLNGSVDEIRISSVVRNETWRNATFNSVGQDDFISFGVLQFANLSFNTSSMTITNNVVNVLFIVLVVGAIFLIVGVIYKTKFGQGGFGNLW